jgi:hypothetical protein
VLIGSEDILVAECKWTGRAVGADIFHDLQRKADLVRREIGDKRISYALCARSGFTPQLQEMAEQRDDLLLFSLEEMI